MSPSEQAALLHQQSAVTFASFNYAYSVNPAATAEMFSKDGCFAGLLQGFRLLVLVLQQDMLNADSSTVQQQELPLHHV